MNSQIYEIEVHRNQQQLLQNAQTLNSSQVGGQAWGVHGTPYWIGPCICPSLGDYEISIQQISDGEPLLNYGAKLRLIMAEPIKGIDLREAIAKLKTALKQCKNEH